MPEINSEKMIELKQAKKKNDNKKAVAKSKQY